jgi:hypothetical protein
MIYQSFQNREIRISGRFLKLCRVRHEPYECLDEPETFLQALKRENVKADLFTFMQQMGDVAPRYDYCRENESLALLPITNYDHWWKKQISDKTRNQIRKAHKLGLQLRVVQLTDDFVNGVSSIYDEAPMRQGKKFAHYKQDCVSLRADLSTFASKTCFVGAYHNEELIGFFKLVESGRSASLMHIISKISHRDKCPSNALIAKAVEICEERHLNFLHYGVWSSGGLGLFKSNHAFERFDIPRYFVPLSRKGKAMLALRLHRRIQDVIPQRIYRNLITVRNLWSDFRFRQKKATGR